MKTWLSLTLAVLLVHLALLQTLPLNLPVTNTPTSPTFATRTVVLTRAPAPSADQTVATQQVKPKAKKPAARAPAREPVVQPSLTPESTASSTSPTALASVDPGATDPQEQPMVDAPADAASAPATAVITPASATEQPASTPATAAITPASAAESATEPATVAMVSATIPEAAPPIPATEVAFNADHLPTSVKLVYRVEANKFPYTLSGELLWQRREQSYQAQLSISTFGQTRVQTSRGQIDPFGLAPERFSDKYRSEVAAHFNRAQGLVSFSANTPNVPLLPGAQDRLSVLVQLGALVASAPQRFSPGTTLRVQTIGPRDGDLWLFTFGSLETLELPGGPQQGLKLVRQPRQLYDQKLEVWLAPDLAYLPARIRITEANGDYVDQKWVASEAADSP